MINPAFLRRGAVAAVLGLTSQISLGADGVASTRATPEVLQTSPTSQPAAMTSDDRHALIIRFLEARVRRDPDDITALNTLAAEYLRRFRLSGDDRDLFLSEKISAQSLQSVPAVQNAMALAARARAVFALHRFAEARDMALQLVIYVPDKRYPLDILGDSLLELGDYDAAADAYKKMDAFNDPDANTEARFARVAMIHGDNVQAAARYDSAANLARQVLPPAPDVVAWCFVQGGQLAFSTGDFDRAEKHYQDALLANPNDWSAIDHIAELRAAQKRYLDAIAMYKGLITRVPRPELLQSLGDVYTFMGNPEEGAKWHKQALEKYLAAAKAGSAHYYHHIAGYFSDTDPNPAEAVAWAKKDIEIRHSVYAWDCLAWAQYLNGEIQPATQAMDKALALGTKDSHLLFHASLIYYRAGNAVKARDCLRQAGEVNPHFAEFHVHRL